jgi:hypothetical protein
MNNVDKAMQQIKESHPKKLEKLSKLLLSHKKTKKDKKRINQILLSIMESNEFDKLSEAMKIDNIKSTIDMIGQFAEVKDIGWGCASFKLSPDELFETKEKL